MAKAVNSRRTMFEPMNIALQSENAYFYSNLGPLADDVRNYFTAVENRGEIALLRQLLIPAFTLQLDTMGNYFK